MSVHIRLWSSLSLAFTLLTLPANAKDHGTPVEPSAGHWQTWVISSAANYRAPAPPGPAETNAELRQMADIISENGATEQAQIAFWDAGAPAYRWMDLINQRALAGQNLTPFAHRVYTYVALAMYDATLATWESKYYYQRRRPSDVRHNLPTAVDVPDSPSYPSEHAATAWAAATVLAYLLPAEAATFQQLAAQAGWSRVLAGVQYPSDYEAGRNLGIKVAQEVIAHAQVDGSQIPWGGSVPVQPPCTWLPINAATPPGNAAAATWKPLLLSSPQQFRPPAPPSCTDASFVNGELKTVHDFPRAVPGNAAIFNTNYRAFYWQSPEGLNTWPYKYADKWIAEDHLDRNPPRVARIYALLAATQFDAFIASQDGKFTYWYIRPSQLDNTIVPLIPVPNFPSYPSNHSTFSAARSEILAYLFPTRADFVRAVGKEGGDSRIWAGIHYPMDNVAGVNLGRSVAQVFINWAKADRSDE
jgi:membrane-associated phospholipid phosphatase